MIGSLRQTLPDAWYGGARWLWLLRPVEGLYRAVVALRRQLYRLGLLSSYRAPKPVVVVGNICVGGTGKTPVVIALVEALAARGIRAGVVSRGYGARSGRFPRLVDENSKAQDCGDEALLLFRRTGCPCVVGPSRADAVRTLLASFDVDLLISDDGLQHYALQRDLEIALVDAQRGHGNGFCLPAGPLREPVSRLDTVDLVLFRGSGGPDDAVLFEQQCLVNLHTGLECPVDPATTGRNIHALAGIGQPGQFFQGLRQAGFSPEEHPFADHHQYTRVDFMGLADRPIIMTEKDAVKCIDLAGNDAWYLRISARLPDALPQAVAGLLDKDIQEIS